MDVLTNLIVVIILKYTEMSSLLPYIVHLKHTQCGTSIISQ